MAAERKRGREAVKKHLSKIDRVEGALAECRRIIETCDRRDNGIGSIRRAATAIQHELRELLTALRAEESKP